MKTKIRNVVTFVLLAAASLTMLFGSPANQSSTNPSTEPDVSLPGRVARTNDSTGTSTRANADLPSLRYGSHIDLNQAGVILDQVDARSFTLEPNQIGVNRGVAVSPNTRAQKFVNPDGSQIIALVIKSSGCGRSEPPIHCTMPTLNPSLMKMFRANSIGWSTMMRTSTLPAENSEPSNASL